MSAEEVLRESEKSAISGGQIISSVTGKKSKIKGVGNLKGFTAAGFITIMIIVFAVLFNSGTLIPAAISERLVEETDMQYADAVESKKIVFQQALYNGEIPENTAEILEANGVLVGYMKDGGFVEGNKNDGELVLEMGDKIITASNFINEVNNDTELYNAFNNATYSRAAYYYDESAEKVFKQIGTNRHNFTDESNFDEVMEAKMGSGSDVEINNVIVNKNEDGSYKYDTNGSGVNSKNNASGLVEAVRTKNPAATAEESALNTADTLKAAETVVRNNRSALFYSLIMEPISQMKAEDGNEVLNEEMNYLTTEKETEVTDVKTTEIIKVKGSPLDSPSLYAVLSGEKIDPEKVQNYSADRILKTVENRLNGVTASTTISTTVASADNGVRGTIGRLIRSGIETASKALVDLVTPTVSKSLVDNSYATIQGVDAGEFLVEGAVNTGRMLAQMSGGTAGDVEAVTKYARLNSAVIAMDVEADRMNRSPFDISSKNTFLGSILYKFAVSTKFKGSSVVARVASVVSVGMKSVASIVPGVYADGPEGYLSSFGDCETIGLYGAVGSATCVQPATFDTSTLNNPFGDAGFKKFVEENTVLSGETRTIREGSVLARFILYNNERLTPFGIMDGGILESLASGTSSVSLASDVVGMIQDFVGASEEDKRIATGAEFVNSGSNAAWQTYKYAQRYVSLARATAALKQYSNGSSAYNNLEYFEGQENPVIAFLNHYYMVASR